MRIESVLTSFLLLASTAAAQGTLILLGTGYTTDDPPAPIEGGAPKEGPFVKPSIRDKWPASLLGSGTFRRALAGRFTGHVSRDVVTLNGTTAILMVAPGVHSHLGALLFEHPAFVVNDIAVLTGRGDVAESNTNLDGLAIVGPTGLFHREMDVLDTSTYSLTQIGGNEWQTVELLATSRRDTPVIFGMEGDGTLHVAAYLSGQYQNTAATSVTLDGAALALASLDWDGNGVDDVAALTTEGLYVLDKDLNAIVTFLDYGNSGDLAIVRANAWGQMTESVAWLRDSGHDVSIRGQGLSHDVPLDPNPSFEYVALSTGDWMPDGHDELFISTDVNDDVTILNNLTDTSPMQPFSYSYFGGARVAVAPSATAGNERRLNGCAPAVADFDDDGDIDFLSPVEPSGVGAPNPEPIHHTLVDNKLVHWSGEANYMPLLDLGYDPEGTGTLTFSIEDNEYETNATHNQVVVWKLAGSFLQHDTKAYLELPVGIGLHNLTVTDAGADLTGDGLVVLVRPVKKQGDFIEVAGLASMSTLTVSPPSPYAVVGERVNEVATEPVPPGSSDPPPEPGAG